MDAALPTRLNHGVFARRAGEILTTLEELRQERGWAEAVTAAIEEFVEREPQAELRRFGEALALARRMAVVQERLDDDRQRLHHGELNHEQRVSVGHHYEMLRQDACTYNHLLREVMETSGQYFLHRELEDWLVEASRGRHEWVWAEMSGAASEIALHAALQGLPELRGLRYATVEEDLAGYDLVAEWQGKLLTIDVKTGRYFPLTERKHGHRHLEISVPREVVREFGVTRKGLDLLRAEARRALSEGATVVGAGVQRQRWG